MATFITLARYTQQGVSKIKDSPSRVDNFRNAAQKAGGSLKSMYLTLGRYDLVCLTSPNGVRLLFDRTLAGTVILSDVGLSTTIDPAFLDDPIP